MKKDIKSIIVLLVFTCIIVVSAACSSDKFTVTYTAAEGGSIVGEMHQTITSGEDGTEVIAQPNEGYIFTHWSDGETNSTRQDKNIKENLTVIAVFTKMEEATKIAVSYRSGEGGFVDGETEQQVPYEQNANTVIATAYEGYEFVKWSDGKLDTERTDMGIKAGFSVTAIFSKIEEPIFIQVNYLAGTGGSIDGDDEQEVLYGLNSDLVTAIADEGYEFEKWSDGNPDAERIDENITAGFTVMAIFSKQQDAAYVSIEYTAADGGYILGLKNQSVIYGEFAYGVTAIPRAGYVFEEWSDGHDEPSRTDLITYEFTVTATFSFLYADGSGTEINPFLIDNYEQLMKMSYYSANYFKLTSDLDLSGINHEPIFDNGLWFNGGFDGGGHIVSNMKVNTYTAYPSLFGYVFLGNIKNLEIKDFEITLLEFNSESKYGEVYAGAVCGVTSGSLTNIKASGLITAEEYEQNEPYSGVGGLVGITGNVIMNCHTEISIQIRGHVGLVGGMAGMSIGRADEGTIGTANNSKNRIVDADTNVQGIDLFNCSSKGSINIISGNVGGLVAYIGYTKNSNDVGGKVNIINCSSEVNLTIANGETTYSGGLIGLGNIYGDSNIINCYATGNIITINRIGWCGGLIGYLVTDSGLITSCYATGNIKALRAGGLIGYLDSNVETFDINYSFASGNIITAEGGGFANEIWNANLYRCYANGNIEGGSRIAGFIYASQEIEEKLIIEECYATGNLIAQGNASTVAGFCYFTESTVINCYSISNIHVESTLNAVVSGLVCNFGGSMINCYYAGKITADNHFNKIISGLATILDSEQQIINCHWLNSNDTLAVVAVDRLYGICDAVAYSEYQEMHQIAEILDANNEIIKWYNAIGKTPQLLFIKGPIYIGPFIIYI